MVLLFSAITMMVSALLLSWIQPLSAKIILPNYGGVPMVWNTCMVFFQLMVLAGYVYAHVVGKQFSIWIQRGLHVLIALACFIFLPIIWQQPPVPTQLFPGMTLLFALIAKLGLPVFLCATTSPMIQNWLSHSAHEHAKDPYFLYSASNIGCILALILFPFVLEPWWGVQQQSWIWSGLFISYLCLFCITIILLPKKKIQTKVIQSTLSFKQKIQWVLLAIVPSSLFLGVTQQITTDLPAIPFLWIVPLLIYFLSFVITFSQNPIFSQPWIVRNFPLFLIFPTLLLSALSTQSNIIEAVIFHLIGLFAVCMICHGELVASRPKTDRLTEFYCWLALGGLLGGLFNTFIAPMVFTGIYEYPIALVAAVLLCPSKQTWRDWNRWDSVFILFIAFALLGLWIYFPGISFAKMRDIGAVCLIVLIGLTFYNSDRQKRFAVSLAFLYVFGQVSQFQGETERIAQVRNFFGVKQVLLNSQNQVHVLMNGATAHGMQSIELPGQQNILTSYYRPSNEIAGVIQSKETDANIAVIGLGVGTMACQFDQSHVTFFEIDPLVVQIANQPGYFSYLQDCPNHSIVLGDGRLELKTQPDRFFDVLIVDAFSSDSIPIHLLTQEALALYLQKLKDNGVIAFHISQRHLDLLPVMRAIMQKQKLKAIIKTVRPSNQFEYSSQWIVFSQDQKALEPLKKSNNWNEFAPQGRQIIWTDDYANLFSVLKSVFN